MNYTTSLRIIIIYDDGLEVKSRLTYSEGYELDPRQYPWLRTKGDHSSSRLKEWPWSLRRGYPPTFLTILEFRIDEGIVEAEVEQHIE